MKTTLIDTLFMRLVLVAVVALTISQATENIKLHTAINNLHNELQILAEEVLIGQNSAEETTATIQEERRSNETTTKQLSKVLNKGNIRVLGAWVYSREDNIVVVEDETGELWEVKDVDVADDDILIVWLADNHTPADRSDDIVLRLWTKTHG